MEAEEIDPLNLDQHHSTPTSHFVKNETTWFIDEEGLINLQIPMPNK